MRLRRIVPTLSVVCCLAAPVGWTAVWADDAAPATKPSGFSIPIPFLSAAPAAPTAAPAASPTPAPTDASAAPAMSADTTAATTAPSADATPAPTIDDLVDTFWHYGKIARYDLAADAGTKVLADPADAATMLQSFEKVAGEKGDNIDALLLHWRSLHEPTADELAQVPSEQGEMAAVAKMKQVSTDIAAKLNDGYATRRSDPDYIRNTIIEMTQGTRAYDNNLPRLSRSGELAVKVLVDMLRDPNDRAYNGVARRILRDLGRVSLAPLHAATEMKDAGTLIDVCSALGDIGYADSVPYLARLLKDSSEPDEVHKAAHNALVHMGIADPNSINVASQYLTLARNFYYGKASIQPSGDKTAYIWFWEEDHGLTKLDVPVSIFGDVMAMRTTEYAMRVDPNKAEAVGLWLAANTRREIDLPDGASDPTHRGDLDAHYYDVSAGVTYLGDALSIALNDRNSALALKLTQSMHDIIGEAGLTGSASDPIIQAIYFPNRVVRFEAAMALAESMPTHPFPGSDRIVPLLVEAMNQTAKPNVLAVGPAGSVEGLRDAIKGMGYNVIADTDALQAVNAAMAMPTIDVIVISEDSDVTKMVSLSQTNTHLEGTPVLVLTHVDNSAYKVRSVTDPLLSAAMMPTQDNLATELKTDIDDARKHSGIAPMTDEDASKYALRAADLLEEIALARAGVLNLAVGEPGILTALQDSRPQIVMAAGHVLSAVNLRSAQNALADKANDTATPDDVRISLYLSLAASAKFYGNHLASDKVDALEAVVNDGKNSPVQSAAATARGALNLPADEARTLILKQSKV